MAISANTVWEYRSAGNSDAGGGFVTGASGTDRTQQDAIHSTRTDIVIDGADNTKITSAADNFASDDVGNLINITAGTGFTTGRYEITAVAAGVATLDRAVGTTGSTGGTGKLGGAVTITDANFEEAEPGNILYIKDDGTHSPGAVTVSSGGTPTSPIFVEGYNTTRGDGPDAETNRPLISSGANAFTLGVNWQIKYTEHTGTSAAVVNLNSEAVILGCKSNNTSGTNSRNAIDSTTSTRVVLCEAQSLNGNGIQFSTDSIIIGCYVHDCGEEGYDGVGSSSYTFVHCIADTCRGGFSIVNDDSSVLVNCTSYNCTTGLIATDAENACVMNMIIDNCTTGISFTSAQRDNNFFMNINFSNNTTDTNNVGTIINETALDPGFADAANGDFSVGTNMKASGVPGVFAGGLSEGFLDLGAVQREEPAGGGGGLLVNPGMDGGMRG